MPDNYSILSVYDVKEVCSNCLFNYKVYNMTLNNQKIKVVVNDSQSVVFYCNRGKTIRLLYKDIQQIELRSCWKVAFILRDSDMIVSGFRCKSMFKQLKQCLKNQLLVIE